MIFRAIDIHLLVKFTFIYDVPQEFMTLTQIDTLIENFFVYLYLIQLQTSLVKMRRIAIHVVVVIGQILRSNFLKHNLDASLPLLITQVCCFSPFSVE